MQYTMFINSVDFSPYLRENGVQQYTVTRNARSVVTMDGTLFRSAVEKVGLRVQLREVRDKNLADLTAALSQQVPVKYTDRKLGDVTKTFYVTGLTATTKTVRGGNTYWSGVSFTLEER